MQELAFFALPSVAGLALGLTAMALSELGIQPSRDARGHKKAETAASAGKTAQPSAAVPASS